MKTNALVRHYFPQFNYDKESIENYAMHVSMAHWIHYEYMTALSSASLVKKLSQTK